ncbi:hypothetical protein B5X24_HaOG203932 [Helicoverpa armigera]|uniref:FLYWCH-type domain-containing protein n=1 Tax=Helicoverpa armigera TaxID=29058 RepID=A0A2W1BRN7_HELAM|nr:hypothetical protein B5X24_HaOG203932 [Helicoverpa armigera]
MLSFFSTGVHFRALRTFSNDGCGLFSRESIAFGWRCRVRRQPNVGGHMLGFDAVPAVYVPSRTGKSLLLHDGYTFYLKNLQAHGRKQWYCSSRDMAGCRADVITAPARAGAGDVLFLVRGRHIHAPPSYYFTPDGKYVRKKDVYHRYR